MEMTGTQTIPAPRERVWKALNDEAVLAQCIDGCKGIERTSPTDLVATVTAKVGPVKANFKGDVTLSNIVEMESYTISGQGKGGAAGFAKGSADVSLADGEEPGTTVLTYAVKAQVGGKLAQVGSRLIDGTARKYADDFFSKLSQTLTEAEVEAASATAAEATAGPSGEPAATGPVYSAEAEGEDEGSEDTTDGMPIWAWGVALVLLVGGLVYFLTVG